MKDIFGHKYSAIIPNICFIYVASDRYNKDNILFSLPVLKKAQSSFLSRFAQQSEVLFLH